MYVNGSKSCNHRLTMCMLHNKIDNNHKTACSVVTTCLSILCHFYGTGRDNDVPLVNELDESEKAPINGSVGTSAVSNKL